MRSNSMEQWPNREYKSTRRQILRLDIRLTGSHIEPRGYASVGRTDSTIMCRQDVNGRVERDLTSPSSRVHLMKVPLA
jgi:hypothetical protein